MHIDSHVPEFLLEEGVEIVPGRSIPARNKWNDYSPVRGIDEIARSRGLWPSRAELVWNGTNHPRLARSLGLANSLIPFPHKGEIAIFVEIDLASVSIFGEVFILQCNGLFALITPPPDTFSFPDTLLVLPSTSTCLVRPDGPVLTSGEWERTYIVRYTTGTTGS